MFLHVSVILFTGGVLSQHALQVVSQHALQQGGLLLGGGSAPRGVPAQGGCLLGRCGDPPQSQTATVADGTYPTGMLSCFFSFYATPASRKNMESVM